MLGKEKFMLRRNIFIAGLILLGASALAAAGEAGRIVFVSGHAQLAEHAAALDNAVQEGDELSTGADGYVYLKTVDSGFLILRPNSKARIVAYHIDTANPANTRVKLELLTGVARSISGQGVKQARQNFRFNTPVAAIGVRGTDFTVFTDQQTSRVAVLSGGVVVSGFSGACGPEGSGPCEGSASRELFAGQAGALLQVERGQRVPQLLHNPTLSPDQNAAPRPDEPVGKVAGGGTAGGADINLDAQKDQRTLVRQSSGNGSNSNGGSGSGSGSGDPTAVVPPPTVVVVPPETVRSAPEVLWGRWQSVAGLNPDGSTLAKLRGDTVAERVFLGPYVMGRLRDPSFIMPQSGTGQFQLASSEAVMERDGVDTLAKVDKAMLSVDFAAQSFNTSLTVTGQGKSVLVNGLGSVSSLGVLNNGAMSDSIIRGYLGGAHAEEAGYLFQNSSTPGITVSGTTKWTR
jgi:hypothetical protein